MTMPKIQWLDRLMQLPADLKKPHIRKKMDVCWELYADKNSKNPLVGIGVAGSWNYPLVSALKILGITVGFGCVAVRLIKTISGR